MCDPISLGIAGLATTVGGQVMGAVGAGEAADRSASAAQATADSIAESYDKKVKAILLQAKQAGKETARQQTDIQKNFSNFEGIIQTGAAMGGVSGLSISKAKQVAGYQTGEAKTIMSENLNNTLKQLRMQAEAERASAMSSINQAQSQVMAPPSPFATALQIGSTVVGGISSYKAMTATPALKG